MELKEQPYTPTLASKLGDTAQVWRKTFHGLTEDFHHALKRHSLVPVGQDGRQLILRAEFLCPKRVVGDLAQDYFGVMLTHKWARLRAPLQPENIGSTTPRC